MKKLKKHFIEIIFENKKKLHLDIQNKKKVFEKEINEEIEKAQKEINTLKKNSSNLSLITITQEL